jgi:hypothetical protein
VSGDLPADTFELLIPCLLLYARCWDAVNGFWANWKGLSTLLAFYIIEQTDTAMHTDIY